ncbi:MAG: Peptidase M23 [Parcubacteria group bacterium GW2011_GWA2_31_28]|nr:MAG: Peptidase M23 [Parcubacteria group bacterium GW2011_GWA2_31_28]
MLKIFLIIAILFANIPVYAANISDLENQLNKLKQKDKELQEKSNQYRVLVSEKEQEVDSFQSEVNYLSSQIQSAESDIAYTNNNIYLTDIEIERIEIAIGSAIDNIEEKREDTGEVLKSMYKTDKITFLETMLTGNFEGFWASQQYLQSFQNKLNDSIQQLGILYKDLERKKENKNNELIGLSELKKKQEIQENVLNNQKNYKKNLLSKSESERKEFQAMLNNTQKQRTTLINDILRIEDEVKRLKTFKLYVEAGKIPPPGTKIFIWPTDNIVTTQGFGETSFARSGKGGYSFHNGIDIGSGAGDNVYAAAEGEIIGRNNNDCNNNIGYNLGDFSCQGGWGNWIAIKHPNELVTLYTHLTSVLSSIKVGDRVEAKNVIGRVGSSGNVTGPHLHFSVYKEFFLVPKGYPGYNYNGTLNPLYYL